MWRPVREDRPPPFLSLCSAVLCKQAVKGDNTLEDAAMYTVFQTVGGDERHLDIVAAADVLYHPVHASSKGVLIVLLYLELCVDELHLAEVDHAVAAVDDQVYLHAFLSLLPL